MGAPQQMLSSYGAAGAGTDPYFANVVLLVDASSYTNGTTPSTLDVIGKTPTYSNNAQIKTDQFKFGTSSLYLDGTNDRVSFPDSADWAMGTGDATWEAWIRKEANLGDKIILSQAASFGGFCSAQLWISGVSENSAGRVSNGASTYGTVSTGTTPGVWSHIAMCRSGATLYLGFDGTVVTTSVTSGALLDSAAPMTLGAFSDADGTIHFKGWMDQVRITKGVARYTGATYAVPAAAFPHS